MADASIDFDGLDEIMTDLTGMENSLRDETIAVLNECADIITESVIEHSGGKESYSYIKNGKMYRKKHEHKGRPHLKDDIKREVKVFTKNGGYVKIKGGKKTGSLWHIINNGHVAGGRLIQGTHFCEKVVKETSKDIESRVDSMIRRVIKNDN